MVQSVIDDFVRDYWPIGLPNGAPARLALYFPNIETRDELRPAIESALLAHGIGPDTLLAVDNKSSDGSMTPKVTLTTEQVKEALQTANEKI